MNKKQSSKKVGYITNIIKLEYIVKVECWCGTNITIDSSKPSIENICPNCGSPYKLIDAEWTQDEKNKFVENFNKTANTVLDNRGV